MADQTGMNESAARAEAMRRKTQPEEQGPLERIHAMLPDWLSARSAVLKKRAQVQRIDQETKEQ